MLPGHPYHFGNRSIGGGGTQLAAGHGWAYRKQRPNAGRKIRRRIEDRRDGGGCRQGLLEKWVLYFVQSTMYILCVDIYKYRYMFLYERAGATREAPKSAKASRLGVVAALWS